MDFPEHAHSNVPAMFSPIPVFHKVAIQFWQREVYDHDGKLLKSVAAEPAEDGTAA
jgi:hypothetical protein